VTLDGSELSETILEPIQRLSHSNRRSARGGEVIDFYLVPLLPLLALDVALAVAGSAEGLSGLF
jgi:hypothetical protein